MAERLHAACWLLREIGVEVGFSRDAVRRGAHAPAPVLMRLVDLRTACSVVDWSYSSWLKYFPRRPIARTITMPVANARARGARNS